MLMPCVLCCVYLCIHHNRFQIISKINRIIPSCIEAPVADVHSTLTHLPHIAPFHQLIFVRIYTTHSIVSQRDKQYSGICCLLKRGYGLSLKFKSIVNEYRILIPQNVSHFSYVRVLFD